MSKTVKLQMNVQFDLPLERIELLLSAINETLEALEDWDFSSRTGFERSEFEQAYSELHKLLKSAEGESAETSRNSS